MGQAQFKEKLGNRGSDKKAVNGFNSKSGTRESTNQKTWEGKTKGWTGAKKHSKGRGYNVEF